MSQDNNIIYDYQDEDGNLLYQVVRKPGKVFVQRRPDGNGGWIYNLDGVTRVLYRLPELVEADIDETIFVVEGEKDADRLVADGLTVTTVSGGAGKWQDSYNRYFKDRLVCVLPDNDKPGLEHAKTICRAIQNIATQIKVLHLPVGSKEDVSDWLDQGGTKTKLLELVEKTTIDEPVEPQLTETGSESWEPPIPLGQFNLPVFPVEAFPKQLCALCVFCEAVAESFQVPVDLPAMLVLSAAGAALAKKIEVHVRGDHREPVNLYTATALEPASRKSQVFREVYLPVTEYEFDHVRRMAPDVEKNQIERATLEMEVKHLQQKIAKANPENREQFRDQIDKVMEQLRDTPRLVVPRFLADDITPERIATLLAENDGRLAIVSPEGDIFDMMAGRYSQKGSNLGIFLKGHAGDDVRVDRVNKDRPPEFIHKPALSIGLTVQPAVLRGLMSQPGFRGRGLLGRFLYSLPQSLLGHRKINPPALSPDISARYRDVIHTALRLAPNVDTSGNSSPHIIAFGSEALQELDNFAISVERALADDGEFANMRDWAGKLVGAVCRIAGIFHGLIHAPTGNPASFQIDGEIILGAMAIGEYLIPHAQAAYFTMGSDPDIDVARKLLDRIFSQNLTSFTKRDAFNAMRGGVHKVDELDGPLHLLEKHAYIKLVLQDRKGPGRKPSPAYEVNPLSVAQNTQIAQNSRKSDILSNSAYCAQFAQEIET